MKHGKSLKNNISIKNNKNNMTIKIIVPVLLVAVAAAVLAAEYCKGNNIGTATAENNPDFALNVTEKIDLDKLKSYRLPIVLVFCAEECPPCQEVAPVVEELNKELQGKAIIKLIDVWKYNDLYEGYPLRIIPTLFFIDSKGNPHKPKDFDAMKMQIYRTKETGKHVFTFREGVMSREQLLEVLKDMGMKP